MKGTSRSLDDRLRAARPVRGFLRKIFPDHWSFLLGEIALYSFIILLLTGTFLTFWFQPSMTLVVYHGSYTHLDGVRMSQAYASTLNISFDVRGGLLMRQIHHWAADLFMAAIFVHMLRIFFTGAYRKPREVNWLIGIVMLTLGMLEGLFGYSLPDDLLSGAGCGSSRASSSPSRWSAPTWHSSCSAAHSPVGAPQLPALEAGEDADEVPAPGTRGPLGRLRIALSRVLTEGIPLPNTHPDGHGNGEAGQPTAATADETDHP